MHQLTSCYLRPPPDTAPCTTRIHWYHKQLAIHLVRQVRYRKRIRVRASTTVKKFHKSIRIFDNFHATAPHATHPKVRPIPQPAQDLDRIIARQNLHDLPVWTNPGTIGIRRISCLAYPQPERKLNGSRCAYNRVNAYGHPTSRPPAGYLPGQSHHIIIRCCQISTARICIIDPHEKRSRCQDFTRDRDKYNIIRIMT
jgi:hypothetical protein